MSSLFEGLLDEELLNEDVETPEEDEVVEIKDEELETPSSTGDDLEVQTNDSNINDVDDMEKELSDEEGVDINDIDDPDLDEMVDADDEDDEDFEEDFLDEACDDIMFKNAKTLDEEIDALLNETMDELDDDDLDDDDDDDDIFDESCKGKKGCKSEGEEDEEVLDEDFDLEDWF